MQNISASYFNFLNLSFLYHLVSHLSTPIVIPSFYFFLKLYLFVMVTIWMYYLYFLETDIDFIRLLRICILYTFINQYYLSRTVEWREDKGSVRVVDVWKSGDYPAIL